jgi:hypothetical protein
MRPLVPVLLLALALPASAQVVPTLDLGVAGGVNFASLGDAAGADLDNATGYHVGVYADVGAAFVSFRTGLYYLSAGDVEQTSGGGVAADFVTVPLDLHVQTPTPVMKAYVLAGPEARFPLGDGGTFIDTREVNVAANVGVGVKGGVPLVGPSGFLEVRYSRDVTGFAELVAEDVGATEYEVHLVLVRAGIGF